MYPVVFNSNFKESRASVIGFMRRYARWCLALFLLGMTPLMVSAQSITSFSPTFGAPGTSVTITGVGFTGTTSVKFGGVDAIFGNVTAISITATVPLGAITGSISVTVSFTASSAQQFQVSPQVNSFTPATGTAGTQIQVNGLNFINGYTTVFFGGVQASPVTVTGEGASGQLYVNVPSGATNAPIIVKTYTTSSQLIGSSTSSTSFVVGNGPFIQDFSPSYGKPGDDIVMNGVNLVVSGTAVKFNGSNATVTVTSTTQLHATVPNNATTGPITVSTSSGTNTTSTNFVVTTGPIITDFNPGGGNIGATVTINGANFLGLTSVKFNGTSASASVTSPSQISATVPSGATTGPIAITTTNGTATTAIDFVVGPAPAITDISPTGGPVGTEVVINGQNFGGVTNVQFNGVNAAYFVSSANVQLHALVPSGATTGPITIFASTGTNSTSPTFVVGSAPTISGFSPASGNIGATVVISGQNFINGYTSVQFNGTNAVATVTSSSQISATVPTGASTGPITVATPIGTNTTATNFFVTPAITGFFPTGGVAGVSITVTGANFTGASAVKIAGTDMSSFMVNSNSSITAVLPSSAVSGTISVTTPAGIVATSTNFHVLPFITSLSATSGAIGDSITINGTGFFNVQNVKFNGVIASTTVNSVNSISATVPNTTSGPLVVTTDEGKATNSVDFVIIPGVTSFSPTRGVAGTSVVITGTSFGSVTAVQFNGATATFHVDSSTQITATVPANAATGKITVTDSHGTGTSKTDFEVVPALFIIGLTNNEVLISWPVVASNYVLAVTTNGGPGASWAPATNMQTTVGDQIRVTNNAASGMKFFRLQK